MKTTKTRPLMGGSGAATIRAAIDAEQTALLDFVTRGRRAQEAVDAILVVEANRSRSPPRKSE